MALSSGLEAAPLVDQGLRPVARAAVDLPDPTADRRGHEPGEQGRR